MGRTLGLLRVDDLRDGHGEPLISLRKEGAPFPFSLMSGFVSIIRVTPTCCVGEEFERMHAIRHATRPANPGSQAQASSCDLDQIRVEIALRLELQSYIPAPFALLSC